MPRTPVPPFDAVTAAEKVRRLEDAWNTRDVIHVARAYDPGCRWRAGPELIRGRAEIEAHLGRKWLREIDFRIVHGLWTHGPDRLALRTLSEFRDHDGNWTRRLGVEVWAIGPDGLLTERHATWDVHPIAPGDRLLDWPPGARPIGYPGIADLAP